MNVEHTNPEDNKNELPEKDVQLPEQVPPPINTPQPPAEPIQVTLVRKRRTWPWVLAVLAALIIIGYVAYWLGKRQSDMHGVAVDDSAYAVDADTVDGWARNDDYERWRKAIFIIPEYDAIPDNFKRGVTKIFIDNKYVGDSLNPDGIYFLTKIKDRAPKVFKFGHFTGAPDMEMAFLLESDDYKSSAIFIIPERGNILYYKKLYNLPVLSTFKKGELINMGDIKKVPAPHDGVMVRANGSKNGLLYNSETKTFEEYYQYSPEEIKGILYEREHGDAGEDEGETESDTVQTAPAVNGAG